MHNKNFAILLVSGTCLFISAVALADTSEDIFRNALNYTVQIKTTVPLPFDGDRKNSSLGAGFLVDAARGWVMTNAHVVSRSPSRVDLAFHGQDFKEATKIYVDPYLDLALIKVNERVDTRGITTPQLDCGGLPAVGHPVGAFGHPWRLQFTGTRGIISGVTAKYRTEMLQTDAPINAGNSGGPLISLDSGKIVGINSATIRNAQNTNFALAMKYACRVLRLLQEGRDPSPPDLDLVYFQDVDNSKVLKVARSYSVPGMLPFHSGDVIKAIVGDTAPIENETQLLHALRGHPEESSIKVLRNSLELVINGNKTFMPRVLSQRGVYASGLLFGPVTFRDADEIRMRGFMVHHVEPGSDGESQEVLKSDLLEAINGEKVEDLDKLFKRLSDAQNKGGGVQFTFKRVSDNNYTMFSYIQRTLTISDLRVIGPVLANLK